MEILVLRKRNKNICEDIKHLRFKPIKSINIYQGSWDWGEVFLSRFMFPSLARPVVQRIKEEEKRMKKGSKARAHFGNGYLIRVRLSISERSRGDFLSLSLSLSPFIFMVTSSYWSNRENPRRDPSRGSWANPSVPFSICVSSVIVDRPWNASKVLLATEPLTAIPNFRVAQSTILRDLKKKTSTRAAVAAHPINAPHAILYDITWALWLHRHYFFM